MLRLSGHVGGGTTVVFCMAVVMGASAVVLGAQGGWLSWRAAREGELWRWGDVCGGRQ